MKRLLKPIRDALASVRALREARKFAPDYSEARLFALLRAAVEDRRASELAVACDAWLSGARTDATQALVAYFASRVVPRFFANPGELLSRDDVTLRRWVDAAAAYAREITERGLPVFGRTAPPLRPGFPWHDAVGCGTGDLLFGVQVHRFAFLPRIALAASSDAYRPSDLAALLDDWIAFAPRQTDLAFCTNLVVIQRLVATTWALAFMTACRSADRDAACARMLCVLAQDVAYLAPRLGDSYPNNHLLADRFAAWYIALLLPELMPERADLGALEAVWCAELARQTYDDGGSIEHATHYHGFACHMAAAYLLLASRNHRPVPSDVRERIGRMLELQSALCGADGQPPSIGDSADAPLFPLDGAPVSDAALREIYRALFDPGIEPLAEHHPARERAYWLLGGALAPRRCESTDGAAMIELPRGGFVVLADDHETTRCVFRTGPTADTFYMPGHMHDDSLSITFTRRGMPLLVDAGTYTYRHRSATADAQGLSWRAYFAGPRAHNGLVVGDHYPFGRMSGDFRPRQRLPEVRHALSAAGRALAVVEAYRERAPECPQWLRGIVHLRGAAFLVYDIVERESHGDAMHFAFQCAPACGLRLVGPNAAAARRGDVAARVVWSKGFGAAEIVSGRLQPTNGWMSLGYGERVAAPQLIVPFAQGDPLSAFAIEADDTGAPPSLDCERPTEHTRAFRLQRETGIDIVLVNSGSPQTGVEAFGCTFQGRVAWFSAPAGRAPVVRWLDGSAFSASAFGVHHLAAARLAEFATAGAR